MPNLFSVVLERTEAVELGAVVVIPASADLPGINDFHPHVLAAAGRPRPLYSSRMPIVGNDVLQSWVDRVRKLGVQNLWLTAASRDDSGSYFGMPEFARQEVDRLLMITLKSYAEMDLADLLAFHCQSQNPVTEAQDVQGQLGVCLLDRSALQATGKQHKFPCAPSDSSRSPYQFRGYAKRILSARERHELAEDALTGACAMRPFGKEIREQVWLGEGVELADSVRVIGPSYIGARTVIRAGATIGPFASVERDCVVDCGTTVERSTVLPCNYLAPGLLIRHGLVDGGYLEDLGGGTVADLQPAGLGARIRPRGSDRQAFRQANVFSRPDGAWQSTLSTSPQPWAQVRL
jgi:carbonic anhydrase/acetyltransferase-like protein (isoleucine patch superfamily)